MTNILFTKYNGFLWVCWFLAKRSWNSTIELTLLNTHQLLKNVNESTFETYSIFKVVVVMRMSVCLLTEGPAEAPVQSWSRADQYSSFISYMYWYFKPSFFTPSIMFLMFLSQLFDSYLLIFSTNFSLNSWKRKQTTYWSKTVFFSQFASWKRSHKK